MYNIGLVVGNVEDGFHSQICKGAMRAAKMEGDNLFIIPVKYFNREWIAEIDPNQKFEYQYNYLIAYAKSKAFDMVILCLSSIAYCMTKEEQKRLLEGFEGVPVLLLASQEDGYSSISYDNVSGFGSGIQYLIQERGCKHLGMLSGNQSNSDMAQRLQIYKDTLIQNGLKVEEELIVYGDLGDSEQPEVEKLLMNNPELDAIVCSNDVMAKAVYKILDKYHFKIGKDICVIGFDDVEESALLTPPLATVRADAAVLGHSAFVEAHKLLDEYEATGEMPVRQILLDTSFVNRESANGQKHKREMFSDEIKLEYQEHINYMLDTNHRLNILTRDMLMLGEGNKRKFSDFLNAFDVSENTSCYLFMLDKPVSIHPGTDYSIDRKLYLQASKINGMITEQGWDAERVSLDELFRMDCFENKPKSYIVIDIYSREKQFGIMVCDMAHRHFIYAENLCYQISMATKIIELLQVQEQLLVEKEVMVQRLAQENLILDNISNKDELTGINNRRGFITQTMDILKDKSNYGRNAAIIYVDLNYLKLINDRYSHAEGNYALQACARALESVKVQEYVPGRIGGDEFALFLMMENSGEAEEIKVQIRKYIDALNSVNRKPYEITMSIGVYEFVIEKGCDLKELLTHADEKLYEDKANKKPFVERSV